MCTALYALTVLNTPWSPNLEPHQCHNTTSFQYRLGLSSICLFSPRQTTVLETPACKGSSSSAGASAMAAGASAMAAGATPCSTWSHSIWSICSLVSWVCTEVSEIQGSKSLEQNNYCATILGSGFRPQKNKSIPGLDTSLLAQILVPLQIQISCCFAKMIQLHQNVIVLTRSDATTSLSALLSLHSQLSFGSRTTGSTDPKIFVCQKLLANRSWFIGRSKNVLCFWNSKRFLTPRCWKKYRWFFPNAESSKMQFHFLATTITYQKKMCFQNVVAIFQLHKNVGRNRQVQFWIWPKLVDILGNSSWPRLYDRKRPCHRCAEIPCLVPDLKLLIFHRHGCKSNPGLRDQNDHWIEPQPRARQSRNPSANKKYMVIHYPWRIFGLHGFYELYFSHHNFMNFMNIKIHNPIITWG